MVENNKIVFDDVEEYILSLSNTAVEWSSYKQYNHRNAR